MNVTTHDDGTSTLNLEEYADLLTIRVLLWSNPGELVFSPFAGIGSEGWSAIGHDRRFYGVELKESYYRTAARNLASRESEVRNKLSLFDSVA